MRLPRPFIIAVSLVSLLISFTSVAADFRKGEAAFEAGDWATAIKELKPFAMKGNVRAQSMLGILYGIEGNKPEAFVWTLAAAEKGDVEAQAILGSFYHYGTNFLAQNFPEALKWYTLAAGQG